MVLSVLIHMVKVSAWTSPLLEDDVALVLIGLIAHTVDIRLCSTSSAFISGSLSLKADPPMKAISSVISSSTPGWSALPVHPQFPEHTKARHS